MTQKRVRSALETRAQAFATAKNVQVCWDNVGAKPTTTHLKVTISPGPTLDPSFGNKHKRYTGALRLSYYSTELNKGMGNITSFIDDLVAYFPRGLQLSSGGLVVNITNTPNVSAPVYEGTFIFVTVDVLYRADDITN